MTAFGVADAMLELGRELRVEGDSVCAVTLFPRYQQLLRR